MDHVEAILRCLRFRRRLARLGLSCHDLTTARAPAQGTVQLISVSRLLLCVFFLFYSTQYSKFVFNHLDESFIEHRRLLLEAYLQKLIAVKLEKSPAWMAFVGVSIFMYISFKGDYAFFLRVLLARALSTLASKPAQDSEAGTSALGDAAGPDEAPLASMRRCASASSAVCAAASAALSSRSSRHAETA